MCLLTGRGALDLVSSPVITLHHSCQRAAFTWERSSLWVMTNTDERSSDGQRALGKVRLGFLHECESIYIVVNLKWWVYLFLITKNTKLHLKWFTTGHNLIIGFVRERERRNNVSVFHITRVVLDIYSWCPHRRYPHCIFDSKQFESCRNICG